MKEFYLLNKYCRTYLVIAVAFAIGSSVGENIFILFYPVVLGGVIPVTLLSCDEKSNWSVYAETFPYTKRELVSSKYLVSLFYLAAMVVLSVGSQVIHMLRATGEVQLQSCLYMLMALAAVGLAVPGIMLPTTFKLGVDKGRMMYYGVVVIACAMLGIFGVMKELSANVTEIARSLKDWFVPAILAAAVIVFVVSWILSVKFYQEREL